MTRMKLLGFLMAGLALVACGDDEVGNGGETGSELDGKQLGSLTAEEADEVCDDLRGQAGAISKEDMCELAGVFASSFGMECETTKQECISAPEEPQEAEEPDTCGASQFAGCTATVAEARACVASIASNFRAITCESTADDLTNLGQSAACAVMEEKCPGSIEGEAEETEGEAP
ncbi:hypothetical protein BE17_33090 [Sorangium cellulosum]|uniref:Secreted protein n=1 Tax=Sorangium cellulosum TaxID=56 RepID=A0A150S315_SORCE|nr:hypothetical protein BE17_33090 [Sorangium cellulosum]